MRIEIFSRTHRRAHLCSGASCTKMAANKSAGRAGPTSRASLSSIAPFKDQVADNDGCFERRKLWRTSINLENEEVLWSCGPPDGESKGVRTLTPVKDMLFSYSQVLRGVKCQSHARVVIPPTLNAPSGFQFCMPAMIILNPLPDQPPSGPRVPGANCCTAAHHASFRISCMLALSISRRALTPEVDGLHFIHPSHFSMQVCAL